MKKKITLIGFIFIGITQLAGCANTGDEVSSAPSTAMTTPPVTEFITQKGTQLYLGDKPFRFSGTNNYYMHYGDNKAITTVLDDAQKMNLNSIRVWGFMDGINHGYTMQPELGVYSSSEAKSSLERLDFTISEANKRGIRVVIALTNNWGDFGGMPQYVNWLGGDHHDDFYRLPAAREAYRNYVEHILTHKNKYTGVVYNQDPTIMTWELANEPRAQSDTSGKLLYSWTKEMSEFVRELAPKQLIALGSEGFLKRDGAEDWAYNGNEGVDWERIITLPNINYGTFHLYPEHWGKHKPLEWGNNWIIEHLEAGKAANKPVVMEEYGIGAAEPFNRDLIYDVWTKTAYENGVAGSMFWILSSYNKDEADKLYPDYDGFRVLADGGRTHQILSQHSKQMLGQPVELFDSVYFAYPVDNLTVTDQKVTVKSYVMSNVSEPESVLLRTSTGNYPMMDPDNDGYFTVGINVNDIGFGEQKLITVATMKDGSRKTDKITVKFDRPITGYKPGPHFDFSDGNLQGWTKEGAWQALWKNPAMEVSNDLGSPMLKLNVVWSGKNDWEELKMRTMRIKHFQQQSRFGYDLYIPVNDGDKGGVRPYAALGDGWVKLGTDKFRKQVKDLEKVTKNGKQYYKQEILIELGDLEGKLPDMFINVVGDKLPLDGSVYLDNIRFEEATYD